MQHRRFPILLASSGLVMFLLLLTGYVGLGWAVWKRHSWTSHFFKEETRSRLFGHYLAVFEALGPDDRDADGLTDGYEVFVGRDPRNPKDHSDMGGQWDTDGFVVEVREALGDGIPFESMQWDRWVKAGEPLPLRGHVTIESFAGTFAAGFQLRMTPPPGYLLAAPGGAPSASPLTVPVGRDGSVGWDVYVTEKVRNEPGLGPCLNPQNAITGEPLIDTRVCPLQRRWDLDPIIPAVQIEKEEDNPHASGTNYHLKWGYVLSSAEGLLVETARDQDGAPWNPVAMLEPQRRECHVYEYGLYPGEKVLEIHGFVIPYTGALKFRVIPTRFSPP